MFGTFHYGSLNLVDPFKIEKVVHSSISEQSNKRQERTSNSRTNVKGKHLSLYICYQLCIVANYILGKHLMGVSPERIYQTSTVR